MLCYMAGAPLHTGPVLLAIAEALHAFLYHTLAHVPLTLPSESFPLTSKKQRFACPRLEACQLVLRRFTLALWLPLPQAQRSSHVLPCAGPR